MRFRPRTARELHRMRLARKFSYMGRNKLQDMLQKPVAVRRSWMTITLRDAIKAILRVYTDRISARARVELRAIQAADAVAGNKRTRDEIKTIWDSLVAKHAAKMKRAGWSADTTQWRRWYQVNHRYQRQLRALRRTGVSVLQFPTSLRREMVR